jgi:Phage integrase, N-terminal SAM-like domain
MVAKASEGKLKADNRTVKELLDAWLDHIEPNRSPLTIRKYRQLAERVVIPELGSIQLRSLTARHLDALYAKLTAKGNKATTVRRVHALVGAALHQAEKWDWWR